MMRLFALISLIAGPYTAAYAQPGALDPAFGDNGKVVVPHIGLGMSDQAVAGVVLPDDRILVAGRSSNGTHFNTVLLRLNADGTPDVTFGTNGAVMHDLGPGSEFVRSSAIDEQGRLVVAGHLFSDEAETNSDMFLARFLADGSLDASFSGTGLLVRDIYTTADAEEAREVLVQLDGKIILAGFTGENLQQTQIVVERYLENGGLDPDFGGDGSVFFTIPEAGKVRLLGATLSAFGGILFCGSGSEDDDGDLSMLLGQLEDSGVPDNSFGEEDGYTWVGSPGIDLIGRTMIEFPFDWMAVAGVKRVPGSSQARILQFFDAGGFPVGELTEDDPDGGDAWNCMLVQNNSALILGGNVPGGPDAQNWNVERLDGEEWLLDPMFTTTDYDEDGGEETCEHLAFLSDSSIVGIGTAQVGGLEHIVLLKYQNDIRAGVTERPPSAQVSVFPNPATDHTSITLSNLEEGPVDITLVDAQGRIARSWPLRTAPNGTTLLQADLSGVDAGVYGLVVNNGTTLSTVKLVKQ